MNIIIKSKNFELTDAIKSFVNEKVGALGRFEAKILEARVDLERGTKHNTGDIFRAEIMMYAPKDLLRAEGEASDLYAAIDLAIQKLKVQLEKYNNRKKGLVRKTKRIRSALKSIPEYFGYTFEEPESDIKKRKILQLEKPLTEQSAIEEMNRLRHSFFIFKNESTGKISVIYKREDEWYGIIEISNI